MWKGRTARTPFSSKRPTQGGASELVRERKPWPDQRLPIRGSLFWVWGCGVVVTRWSPKPRPGVRFFPPPPPKSASLSQSTLKIEEESQIEATRRATPQSCARPNGGAPGRNPGVSDTRGSIPRRRTGGVKPNGEANALQAFRRGFESLHLHWGELKVIGYLSRARSRV